MKIGVTERGDGGLTQQPWKDALENKRVDGVIVITKAPERLLESIDWIKEHPVVVHCTITGFGGSFIEPGVSPQEETIPAYHKLKDTLGNERVVFRIDPILPAFKCGTDFLPGHAEKGGMLENTLPCIPDNARLLISFMDMYSHVKDRFAKYGITFLNEQFHQPLEWRKKIWEALGKPDVCGEPGLPCSGCVSKRDIAAMGLDVNKTSGKTKDQRKTCMCLAEKTELLTNKGQCAHGCLYCYWK